MNNPLTFDEQYYVLSLIYDELELLETLPVSDETREHILNRVAMAESIAAKYLSDNGLTESDCEPTEGVDEDGSETFECSGNCGGCNGR